MTVPDERSHREDQALRGMAERLEKELTVTQHLLKIARLHQRTPWAGERTAAAEAFTRAARGTPWEGLTPEQFLRGDTCPQPEPAKESESKAQAQSRRDRMDERPQDQHETVNGRSTPKQQPAGQSKDKIAWGIGLAALFVVAAIVGTAAGVASRLARQRNPPPPSMQMPSSSLQAKNVAPSDDSAPPEPKKVSVVEVRPGRQEKALVQTVAPVAPEAVPPALPASLTPEHRAELVVYHLTAVENRGNIDDLSAYYSDTINYYGKPTPRSGVVGDKIRFMRRWPNRRYTIRPESLTVTCDVMRCTADGMIDFDVSNAGKRSIGTATFTYYMVMKHNKSEPPDLLITAEDSTVVKRTVTDIGPMPMAAP